MIEIPSKMGTNHHEPGLQIVPSENPNSQYLKISPSTMRYRKLTALAHEFGCSWQEIARLAIDTYLNQNSPKQV